jgi:hypothetical protein
MAVSLLTLSAMGTLGLLATTLHAQLWPLGALEMRRHFLAALTSTFILVMAHSFIMFFLIATGVELKDLEKQAGWGDSFRRRTVSLKSRVFPAATGTLLLVIVNFILGAAAHTRALPGWAHAALAWATVAACLVTLAREYEVLGANNRLIAEAASRREDRAPAPAASDQL